MNLKFVIENQILKRNDENIVVSKSQNYLYCEFEFETGEWNGIERFAIFKDKCGNAYNVLLENDKCQVPDDVLYGDFFKVSVYGGDLITTTEQVIVLLPSGYTTDISRASSGTRDVYVQAFERINRKLDDITYEHDMLYIYGQGKLLKTISLLSEDFINDLLSSIDLSPLAFTGSYNDLNDVPNEFPPEEHIHTSEDITDFEERTAIEIKKSYQLLSNKIRTYGE